MARAIWIDTPRSVVSNSPGADREGDPGGGRLPRHRTPGLQHRLPPRVVDRGAMRRSSRTASSRQHDGKPEARYCLVPAAEVEILDTWHTRGMRGTGTHHFEVKDVFVPAERTFLDKGAPQLSGGPRYKIPFGLSFAAGDGRVALGCGAKLPRRILRARRREDAALHGEPPARPVARPVHGRPGRSRAALGPRFPDGSGAARSGTKRRRTAR